MFRKLHRKKSQFLTSLEKVKKSDVIGPLFSHGNSQPKLNHGFLFKPLGCVTGSTTPWCLNPGVLLSFMLLPWSCSLWSLRVCFGDFSGNEGAIAGELEYKWLDKRKLHIYKYTLQVWARFGLFHLDYFCRCLFATILSFITANIPVMMSCLDYCSGLWTVFKTELLEHPKCSGKVKFSLLLLSLSHRFRCLF